MLFDFNLNKAIYDQILAALEETPFLPLSGERFCNGHGVYVIYWGDMCVYAGKATTITLKNRLGDHIRKLQERGFDIDEFNYRVLEIGERWLIRAGEDYLIKHLAPLWNTTGFGNHPPGRGREGTGEFANWHKQYPPMPIDHPLAPRLKHWRVVNVEDIPDSEITIDHVIDSSHLFYQADNLQTS